MAHNKEKQMRNNTYFVMRHGRSKANEQGIIISHPDNGVLFDFALSDVGREQVLESARVTGLGSDTIIYSSDFSRAHETAEIVGGHIDASEVIISRALRERNFGAYEKTDHANYQLVWNDDVVDAAHKNNGVESVKEVVERVTNFIDELEGRHYGRQILLVSHGDTLQILQTVFCGIDGSQHRSLPHLETAEIREL